MAAIDQLFVREKYTVYMALRPDSALKEYRELKRKQRERAAKQWLDEIAYGKKTISWYQSSRYLGGNWE